MRRSTYGVLKNTMTLNLHENLKSRLIETLTKTLPLVEVRNGMFINTGSRIALFEVNEALPQHGPVRESLVSFVDDLPLITFIYDVLQAELLDFDRYDSETPSQKLTEIKEFADPSALASRLVEQLDSLPWQYAVSIQMPHDVSEALSAVVKESYQLSSSLRLVRATEPFGVEFPLNCEDEKRQKRIHGGGSLLFPKTEKVSWADGKIYLQIVVDGFIGPYGGSMPATQAEQVLKSFLGLGLALRLFEVSDTFFLSPPTEHFYVHRERQEGWQLDTKFELGTDLSATIRKIALNQLITGAPTGERKVQLINLILTEMSAVFSGGEKSDPIMLAATWLVDSYAGRDQRMNYIQAMVVLEVLMGDKATSDIIGLGELLRNRCAYLIGRSQRERESILKDFDEIYKVRSQIVHRGKARLTFKERILFSTLRNMCDRVIQKEVDLLRAK
jgi:hypothetical protein